jgi:ACR3 family arsenite transporter
MGTVSKVSLLATLVYLFMLQGGVLMSSPLVVALIAVPLFIQTVFIFAIGYKTARVIGLRYEDAAPAAMIGASNHFEVAIATAVTLFGVRSGAALATVVGVLIEVPVMLMLVKISLRTRHRFKKKI